MTNILWQCSNCRKVKVTNEEPGKDSNLQFCDCKNEFCKECNTQTNLKNRQQMNKVAYI